MNSSGIAFKLQCHCSCDNQASEPQLQNQQQNNLTELYTRFGKTLQEELRKQHEQSTIVIDELNSQIFNLKQTVSKLEMRHRRDSEVEQQLRRQYNLLLQKSRRSEPQLITKVEIIQKVRQIPCQIEPTALLDDISRFKKRLAQSDTEVCKIKMEKQILQLENQRLRQDLEQAKIANNKLKKMIDEQTKVNQEKQKQIQKQFQQIQYLKTHKQVVVETKHVFPEFRPQQRNQVQTKYETIYIQKPVQKLVFIEVEKRIKEFIQPQQPLVNRIITCAPTKSCNCDSQEKSSKNKYQSQVAYLNTVVDKLESNVNLYKDERDRLAQIIATKDSELNSLETRLKLSSWQSPPRYQESSNVNVTITRLRDEEKPISQNTFINKTEKQTRKRP